ncbi:MAG: hypothetical protein HY927_03465 [Elusimicrobia bacterium]|nr:hypothetical protein [Elusimicrobiota bacterium]
MTRRLLPPVLAFAALLGASRPVSAEDRFARILLIGDSHAAGPFGTTLDALLRDRFGPGMATYAVCGASLRWWQASKRPKLGICHFIKPFGSAAKPGNGAAPADLPAIGDLLALRPTAVIVALGSNPDGTSMDDTITAGAELLARLPPESACTWVGPPPMPSILQRVDLFYQVFPEILRRGGRTCLLIDSRDYLKPEQSSHDHFYGKPAKEWGRAAYRTITAP